MEPQPRAGSPLAANSAQHNVIEDMTAGHTGDDHRSVARRLVKSDLSPRTRGQVELSDRSEEDRVEDDQNGEDGVDSDEAGRAGDIPPMIHSRTNISDLGFEILDTIFSYFSNPPSATPESGHSHYENQQNLLAFCQVNKAFYRVARWVGSPSFPDALEERQELI